VRGEKQALVSALIEIGPEGEEDEELAERLKRIPDLARPLARATPAFQRQVFEAFELHINYDKLGGRIEISATVSDAVAAALENTKPSRRRAHWWSRET
jgi:hypothetical protein